MAICFQPRHRHVPGDLVAHVDSLFLEEGRRPLAPVGCHDAQDGDLSEMLHPEHPMALIS